MATPEIKPIKQFARAGDNYAGRGSSDGTYIYVPSVTAGIATLSKYDLKGTLIWEKNLSQGGSGGTSVIAPDGSILVASSSGGASGKSSALAKFNPLGEKLWEITNAYLEFGAIAIRENTIYVGGGTTTTLFNSAKTAFINAYTLDTGKLVWNKTYPNTGASGIGEIRIDGDQIYVSAGPYGKQDFDYAMAGRLDLDGNIIWWKNGPSSDWNNLVSIKIIGNSVIGTGYKADGGDRQDARIMSFNISDGTIQWDKSWGDSNAQGGNSIESLNGKLYVSYSDGVGWNTGSNNTGFTVVDELDTSGNLLKSYKFDVPTSYDGAGGLVKVGESLYLLGQTNGTIAGQTSGGGSDIYLASVVVAPQTVVRGNSLYTIVDGPSWTQAEANSVKLGGHLTAINDKQENDWIASEFSKDRYDYQGDQNPWDPPSWHHLYLGGLQENGAWKWSNGEKWWDNFRTEWVDPSRTDTPVLSGLFNVYLRGQYYLGDGQGTFVWYPIPDLTQSAILSQNKDGKGIAETPFIRRGDSAYVIVLGPTWEEAEANAVKLGGHLVTINDAAENEWVFSTVAKGIAEGIWLGATDKDQEGTWKWADGTPWGFTNWNQGQPDNATNLDSKGEDYLQYVPEWSKYGNGGKWNDITHNYTQYPHRTSTGIAEIKLAPNNNPTGTPTLSGTLKAGQVITIDKTPIQDSDNFTGYTPDFKYSWEVSNDNGSTWSKLTSADATDNNSTYTLTTAEVGKKVRGVVSYLDGYGTNEVVNSATSIAIETVTPTYTLTPSATTINEGATLTTVIATTNVATGTKLYYALSGTGITTADSSVGALTGEGTTDATGKFTFTHTLANDLTTEGTETIAIKLFTDSARSVQVGSTATVSVFDTSTTPTPTYTLTPSTSTINEGSTLTTSVATTNVSTGTKLYYALSGTGITTADFSAGALTGEGITDSAGKFTFTHTLANDLTTEGAETLSIKLYSDSARTLQVGSTATVSIVDTSTTPAPTYTLTPSATSINEGKRLTTTITTTGVDSLSKLYYSLSGTGITTADFSIGNLTGEGTTDSWGKFTFFNILANDLTTEGAETLSIKLYSDSARTVQVGSTATVLIEDTSVQIEFTGTINNDVLTGNSANNTIKGLGGADILTGSEGADTFVYALADSRLAAYDHITDLAIGTDLIDAPNALSAANLRELGAVSALTQAGIAGVLTTATFVRNGAATFSFGTGSSTRTFLALNDGIAGYSSTADGLIEITGFTGALTNLALI